MAPATADADTAPRGESADARASETHAWARHCLVAGGNTALASVVFPSRCPGAIFVSPSSPLARWYSPRRALRGTQKVPGSRMASTRAHTHPARNP